MNLNDLAESDLQYTLEDNENGFGVSLTFLNSEEEEVDIVCNTTDIGFFLDPETGCGVQSRVVEISGRIQTLNDNDITIVKGSIVQFFDTAGNQYKMDVRQKKPDRKLGVLTMTLEVRE